MRMIVFDPIKGETYTVETSDKPSVDLETLRQDMLGLIDSVYKDTITGGFTSSATGTPILYGYAQQDQLNYSKWANVLALDTTRASVTIGTVNDGVTELTRDQFLTFVNDATNFEMGLYQKKKSLQDSVNSATTFDELFAINISF